MELGAFESALERSVNLFRQNTDKVIRIIGHLDSDGLSAASIIIKALKREGIKFALSIVKQVDERILNELSREDYSVYLFVDLGSGYVKEVASALKEKKIFILDHHKISDKSNFENVVHLNPDFFGFDGGQEISGSGMVYFFSRVLNEKNKDLAYLALIGAIGDMQENKGFEGLNKQILQDSIDSEKIVVKQGLNVFGMQTRPIHKVLEYSTDPYIPGVTGDQEGALSFLTEIGIDPKTEGGRYKKLINLDKEDMKKLVTGIILKRLGSEDKPDDVLGPIYLLKDESEGLPTKDAREFSTLLNACGRLNKPSLGIGACLGVEDFKCRAIDLLTDYKRAIINALNWFYDARKEGKIVEKVGYVLISAGDNVRDSLIGTLASIISKSNLYEDGTVLVSMAYTLSGELKVSVRVSGHNTKMDLRDLIRDIVDSVGGIAGGHKMACGAVIPLEKEEEFLRLLRSKLEGILQNRKLY